MPTAAHARISEAEFLRLPESVDRIELLDGEVVVSPSPGLWHQEVLGRLYEALRIWERAQSRSVTVVIAALDVRFAPGRVLQPDLLVFRPALPKDLETPVTQVPELCVEVLSANRAYDRVTKRLVYAAAGVTEYWLVGPAGHVERRTGAGLAHEEIVADRLTTPLLPGFTLDVRGLLAV